MTEQTQPTDAEIEHLYQEETGFSLKESPAALLDFARAVLAKWGTPAGAGEVVAWMAPHLHTFKGATKVHFTRAPGCTMTDAELMDDLEGRVMWSPSTFSDSHGVTDKFGVYHKPKPLYTTPQPTQAQAMVEVPAPLQELVGDASMAHEQCRAVVHLALMLAEVYAANAAIVAHDPNLADQIGYASAQALEWIGDELNATDATAEDDEWVDPIIEAAQECWPTTQPSNSGSLPEMNEINGLQHAMAHIEKCAVCGDGNARLLVMRNCDVCGSDYAGQSESEVNAAIWRACRATQAQAGAVPLTDEQCDAIYEALDAFGREVDHYEYGLPYCTSDGETLAKPEAREVIRQAAQNIKGADHG